MKKAKFTLGMMVTAFAAMSLSGCNEVKYSPEGYILTYTNAAGEVLHYSADDLFKDYYQDSSKVSSMFDSIYKLVIRNYFVAEEAGKAKYSEILKNAKNDVEGVKSKAEENAKTNSTNYDDEFDALLKSYSCDDEDELLEHFIYERESKEFNDQFYENNIELLRDSKKTAEDPNAYDGYIDSKLPYHVRHILVKISDSGTTNYYNSTIDKDDAIGLWDVANALREGKDSFGRIAQLYSDDTSASSFGDLGIMDKDTSFVNEFKLGVYAYENIYNQATKDVESRIKMSETLKTAYKDAAEEGSAIVKIPYGAFEYLKTNADVTKDNLNRDVNDGASLFFPRNIIFNKYLNKHAIGVITPDDIETGSEDFTTAAFKDVEGLGKILCTKDGQPILVVRAGTSDYQGVHFIVVQRTPLIDEVNGVKLSQYYTTKRPDQEGYPKAEDGTPLQTYVNFLDQEVKEYKSRAEAVESKIKGFDSALNKFIYRKYVESEKIKFSDADLQAQIDKWIDAAAFKKSFDESLSWNETWEKYIETLKVQNEEREKLVVEACAIGFKTHTGTDWDEGGACYDNKNR